MRARKPTTATFVVLGVAVASFAMLQSLIVPVMPRLQTDLGTDQRTITWILTGYLISASVSTPLAGRLGDVVGKARMLTIALGCLALGSAVAATVHDVRWLIAARVLQGVGAAVVPLSYGIIREQFEEGVGQALAVIGSLTAAGFGIGIVVAGPVYDFVGYRGMFLLPMVITSVTAVAAVFVVLESPYRSSDRLPIGSAVLLSLALIGILLAVSQGSAWGLGSWRTGTSALVGLVGGAAWVTAELRGRVPLVDLGLMRMRGLWTSNAIVGCLGFTLFAFMGFLPQMLQTPTATGYGLGADLARSGFLLLPWAVGTFAAGFVTAPLVRRTGARGVVTVSSLVTAAAFAGLAVWHGSAWQIGSWTTLQGLGSGVMTGALAGVVVASVRLDQTGVASGMNANFRSIGGAFGAAAMGAIVTAGQAGGEYPREQGYVMGFAVLAGIMVVAAGVSLWIPSVTGSERATLDDVVAAELTPVAGAPAPVRPPGAHARRSRRRVPRN